MATPFRLWEHSQIVQLLDPAADSGGRTSLYISMKNAQKAYVIFSIKQGAANTILLSVLQGQTSSGTNSKAVSVMPIVSNEATGTNDTLVAQTAAATYTTSAATTSKVVMFEIQPEAHMDINNATPFDHIAVSTGASSASNITSAMLVLMPVRNALFPPQAAQGV